MCGRFSLYYGTGIRIPSGIDCNAAAGSTGCQYRKFGDDTRFFKCSFTKKEGVFLVAATIIVYVMMKLGTYHDSFFGRHIILHNSVLQNVVFFANTTFIIIYIFYYLSSYAVYINKSEEFLRRKLIMMN